jgi:elongation factor P
MTFLSTTTKHKSGGKIPLMPEFTKGGNIRKGMYIKFKNDPFLVVKADFMSPGKGSAFMRVRFKNARTGSTQDFTYKSTETVEVLDVVSKQMQFLFQDGEDMVFMDPRTYEQTTVLGSLVEDYKKLLTPEIQVYILLYNDNPIGVTLPPKVRLKVAQAEHAVGGDTVGGAKKNVTLETGLVVQAPLFVNEGDTLIIDTETQTYVSRG